MVNELTFISVSMAFRDELNIEKKRLEKENPTQKVTQERVLKTAFDLWKKQGGKL